MLNLTEALSDISRTNQIRLDQPLEEVAEKLFQYLFKAGKGIEHFSIGRSGQEGVFQAGSYRQRHRFIKEEIQKRLSLYGEKVAYSDIQYFFSPSNGENNVFFLSPNTTHSGWKKLFCDKWGNSNRERIFNLIFKFHILAQGLPIETIKGFEELLLIHSKNTNKSDNALFVWGQSMFVNFNYYNVLTLTLSRKIRRFLPKDEFRVVDGDEVGELLFYKKQNFYFERDLDGRKKNSIQFMQFDKDNNDFDKFKKTQLYNYQNLMTQLERFLDECDIAYQSLPFQSTHYLENSFVENVKSVESLEVINNTGIDLTETDKRFLDQLLKHQGVSRVTFFAEGKTVGVYEQAEREGTEDEPCWKISENVPWSEIELDQSKNYLIFNKRLDEETGSMAYQGKDGLWYPSMETDEERTVDLYSQLRRRYQYLTRGIFFSTQGINVTGFRAVGDETSSWSVLSYSGSKIDRDILDRDTQTYSDGRLLDIDNSILCYLMGQHDGKQWEKFCERHKIKLSPEFQKVLIELGIKNWIRQSIIEPRIGLPITGQPFSEQRFFAIYVRSPQKGSVKAAAVEFIYKEGSIYINDVTCDEKQIKTRFQFLRKRGNTDRLKDGQQYYVDEEEQIYVSCFTDDFYSPTLIGRNGILEDMQAGELRINRQVSDPNSSRLLPLVTYYSGDIKPTNRIQNMICFDLANETFVQYYVPPGKGIERNVKRGFRVYHLIGNRYTKESIPTSELIKHPLVALHFSTLTQNILRLSDNSQSSLLQKVAKVLVEN